MERAGVVGFMLVILIFLVGLSNDIGRLSGEGFQVRYRRSEPRVTQIAVTVTDQLVPTGSDSAASAIQLVAALW